jgi:hypothetical protein
MTGLVHRVAFTCLSPDVKQRRGKSGMPRDPGRSPKRRYQIVDGLAVRTHGRDTGAHHHAPFGNGALWFGTDANNVGRIALQKAK